MAQAGRTKPGSDTTRIEFLSTAFQTKICLNKCSDRALFNAGQSLISFFSSSKFGFGNHLQTMTPTKPKPNTHHNFLNESRLPRMIRYDIEASK